MEEAGKRSKRQIKELITDDTCRGDGDGRKKAAMETISEVAEADHEQSQAAVEVVPSPPPSDEEVDEFFAILRRMHTAIEYFNRRGAIIGTPNDKKGWRSAVEAAIVEEEESKEEVDNECGEEEKIKRTENLLLDLNSSPEEGHGHDSI